MVYGYRAVKCPGLSWQETPFLISHARTSPVWTRVISRGWTELEERGCFREIGCRWNDPVCFPASFTFTRNREGFRSSFVRWDAFASITSFSSHLLSPLPTPFFMHWHTPSYRVHVCARGGVARRRLCCARDTLPVSTTWLVRFRDGIYDERKVSLPFLRRRE